MHEPIRGFAPPSPTLTRRRLFGLLPAAALPGVSAIPTPPGLTSIPALSPPDLLAKLASHYSGLVDLLVSIQAECDRLDDAGDGAAADALHEARYEPAAAAFRRAERALMVAMSDRDMPLCIVGRRLFVNTCLPIGSGLQDCMTYVLSYSLGADEPREAIPIPAS